MRETVTGSQRVRGRRQGARGQIAILFIALMAFVLVLVGVTVNVGQMAQVRVETSNSVDAGALAAASWMASGQNEASWIARKMWDTIWMTKALYLVPLCTGGERRAYAELLWASLVARRGSRAPCTRRRLEGCGPNSYYRHLANGAMESAWRVGSREYLTASFNNLLIRSPLGPAADCPWCVDYGDLPEYIENVQKRYYDDPASAPIGVGPAWAVGVEGTPDYREHHTGTTLLDYPSEAPTMAVSGKSVVYAQYNEAIPLGTPGFPYFPCSLNGGVGIRNTDTAPSPIPEAELPDSLPDRPLGIHRTTGFKRWDMDLRNMIPSVDRLTIGNCSATCGMAPQNTNSHAVAPSSIQGGDGTVEARTSHYVRSVNPAPYPVFFNIQDKFVPVGSEATASFTSADVTSSGITDVPQRNAKAELQSVR